MQALAMRGEEQVPALAEARQRGAARDGCSPAEPGREQERASCQDGTEQAGPGERGERQQRDREREERTGERQRGGSNPRRRPPPRRAILPGPDERVRRHRDEKARQHLAQDPRHVVLRKRVERADRSGEQREPLSPEPAEREGEDEGRQPGQQRLHGDDRIGGRARPAAPGGRQQKWVTGRAVGLPLGRSDRRGRNLQPRDVDAAERRRIAAMQDRLRCDDVRLGVADAVARERHVHQAVQARDHAEHTRGRAKAAFSGHADRW